MLKGITSRRTLEEMEAVVKRVKLATAEMICRTGVGHLASCLSVAEILGAVYMGLVREGDKVVVSKGHVAAIVYQMLAELGIIPQEMLEEYPNGKLCSHIHNGVPGVTVTTGSLGHGLGTAVGMAEAMKLRGDMGLVVCIMGDGECQEGSVWEAARLAQKWGLGNVLAVVDMNGVGATDYTGWGDPISRWNSFGWAVKLVDGHSIEKLTWSFRDSRLHHNIPPVVVLARTIKGNGISFMESQPMWHSRVPCGDEVAQVMGALR